MHGICALTMVRYKLWCTQPSSGVRRSKPRPPVEDGAGAAPNGAAVKGGILGPNEDAPPPQAPVQAPMPTPSRGAVPVGRSLEVSVQHSGSPLPDDSITAGCTFAASPVGFTCFMRDCSVLSIQTDFYERRHLHGGSGGQAQTAGLRERVLQEKVRAVSVVKGLCFDQIPLYRKSPRTLPRSLNHVYCVVSLGQPTNRAHNTHSCSALLLWCPMLQLIRSSVYDNLHAPFQETVQKTAQPFVLCCPRPLSHRQPPILLFHVLGGCSRAHQARKLCTSAVLTVNSSQTVVLSFIVVMRIGRVLIP